MNDLNERIKEGKKLNKKIKNISKRNGENEFGDLCVKKLTDELLTGDIKMVIKPRDNVEIIHLENDGIPLSIKTTLLNSVNKDMYSKHVRTNDIYIEAVILELCKILNYERICPNVPLSFGSYICNACEIMPRQEDKCLMILSEYATLGDLENFLKRMYCNVLKYFTKEEVIMNLLFQIYAGLYSLQKYFNITHHDLHGKNILVHKLDIKPKNGKHEYIEYKIDGYKYYIPNLGFFVTIWDFGYATIPNKLMRKDLTRYYTNLRSILNDKNLYKTRKIEPGYIQIPRLGI